MFGQKCLRLLDIGSDGTMLVTASDMLELPDWIWDVVWIEVCTGNLNDRMDLLK